MSDPLPFLGDEHGWEGGWGTGTGSWLSHMPGKHSTAGKSLQLWLCSISYSQAVDRGAVSHAPTPKPTSVSLPGGHLFPLNTVTHKVPSVSTSPTHSFTSAVFWQVLTQLSAQLTGPGEH